ncbi:MAG: FliM/FliN family flagellar motor switch protein [Planctomycetes bacterium]|jgi:flagellar motor switch protein FliM|nr:FliM/FliN family flagellar motor switch protein [Planctomycetota bacterium]
MMGPSANDVNRARIGRLLAAVGSRPTPDPAPPDVTPYDWRDPHVFTTAQRQRLVQALGQVATQMAEVFGRSRPTPVEVVLESLTQHFAAGLCRHLELQDDWCVTFGPEKGPPCGFAFLTPPSAMAWVTGLLGDTDTARAPDQALSTLEESLLSDLVSALLGVFLTPLRAPHNLRPIDPLGKGPPGVQFEPAEALCRAVFQVKNSAGGPASEIIMVLPCSRLAALAGQPAAAAPRLSPQELSQTLMTHLQEMPVAIRAVLASTTLTFREILDLGPGDILLFDKPVTGLADLVIDGRAAFHGRPARALGQHALVLVG